MNTALKLTTYLFILAWGSASVFVLCAEDTPGHEMSSTFFYTSKALAGASLYGCVKFYKYLVRKGVITEDDDV